jgi:hypothetical protein
MIGIKMIKPPFSAQRTGGFPEMKQDNQIKPFYMYQVSIS